MRHLQHLLANDLADKKPLRLVGHVVRRVERLPFRKILQEQFLEDVDVGAVRGRDRHDLDEWMLALVVVDDREQFRFRDEIDFVQREDRRRLDVLQQRQHESIAGAWLD